MENVGGGGRASCAWQLCQLPAFYSIWPSPFCKEAASLFLPAAFASPFAAKGARPVFAYDGAKTHRSIASQLCLSPTYAKAMTAA
jgi:hypothetical protein